MTDGTIISINARGFGFIEPQEPGANVFFHASALCGELEFGEHLRMQRVRFEAQREEKGMKATAVWRADDNSNNSKGSR